MGTEDKMRRMYEQLHGEVSGSCSLEYDDGEYGEDEPKLEIVKDGCPCWQITQ